MSVSSIALDQSTGTSGWRSSLRQANQEFEQLVQALQSGNLSAAQQAYSSFPPLQAAQNTAATPPTSAPAPTTSVAADWSALGQALQSGSLTSAQSALGQLEQDAQLAWQAQVQQQTQNAHEVYALMQTISGASNGQSSASTVQGDLSALNQALQSGNTASAQALLAQLEQDLQSSGQYLGRHHHHLGIAWNAAAAAPTPPASTNSASGSATGSTGSGTTTT